MCEGLVTYYKKGSLQSTVPFEHGEKNGVAIYYFEGNELYKWTQKNGKHDGYNESTYDDSTIRFKGTYVDAKLQGECNRCHGNVALELVSFFKDNKLDGSSRLYHKNVALFAEGTYNEGREVGEWKYYQIDGSLASHEIHKGKGRLKKLTFYDENGNEMKSKKKDQLTGVVEEKKTAQKYSKTYL